MSELTYTRLPGGGGKPLVWLHGQIKTPPLSRSARVQMGYLLRLVQQAVLPGMPHSRWMKRICAARHELRVKDSGVNWRLVYRVDEATELMIEVCQRRLAHYNAAAKG
jgi:hypothetical protein